MLTEDSDHFMEPAARLMSKVRTDCRRELPQDHWPPGQLPANELRSRPTCCT